MQKGFATLEVILMVVVIGILASIAVPRFSNITAKANTAKIQADLSTIDTAIAVYEMENGKYLDEATDIKQLENYIQGAKDIKPPQGYAYVEGKLSTQPFSDEAYGITVNSSTKEARAYLSNATNTAEKFYLPRNGSSGDNSGGGNENSGGEQGGGQD